MSKLGTFPRLALPVVGALLLLLFSAASSRADGVSFSSPTGDLGSAAWTYMLDGIPIVATAFNGGNLFGKNSGVNEQGVGLTGDPSGQHEIFAVAGVPQDYIQLNLGALIAAGFTNIMFEIGSTQGVEHWQVTACATAGTPGAGPCAANGSTLIGVAQTFQAAPSNLSAADPFLDISANNGNVLLEQIAATAPTTTPEPSSLGLLLAGMLGVAGISLMRRNRIAQA
jgi:PEP-CTERM motif